jgi:hypothetical protein
MKIKIIFPFLFLFIGIITLLVTTHKIDISKKKITEDISGKDLYIAYVIKPMDIHKNNYPLIIEKLNRDNFNFLAFKASLKVKAPKEIKKILLQQEMHLKDIIRSTELNIIVIKNYRISSISLNERVLEIIHGFNIK